MSGVLVRLRELSSELTPAEARVAGWIERAPGEASALSINDLAQRSETSEATVVRLCKKLELRGYPQLRLALAREYDTGALTGLHEDIAINDDAPAVLAKVFGGAGQALTDTLDVVDAEQTARAIELLQDATSINFFGIGASGTVAEDAYYRFAKLGLSCYALTESSAQLARVATMGTGDVVVAISHSGRTRDVIYAVEQARKRGARTVSVTQYGRQPLVACSDIVLFTSSRETAFRSEAMASRIAQYALLDSLFIGVALMDYESALANLDTARELTTHMRIPANGRDGSRDGRNPSGA